MNPDHFVFHICELIVSFEENNAKPFPKAKLRKSSLSQEIFRKAFIIAVHKYLHNVKIFMRK